MKQNQHFSFLKVFFKKTKKTQPSSLPKMPREVKNLKEFLKICTRKDARYLKIKKPSKAAAVTSTATKKGAAAKSAPTKFKVRCSRFLYTFTVNDKKRAERIQKSIHSNLKKITITKKAPSGKRVKTAAPTANKKKAAPAAQ